MITAPGSSPLARGLQCAQKDDSFASGIIPARAGFTWRSRRRRRWRSGSSPLARGLLWALAVILLAARIIPARAGFTTAPRRAGRPPTDHPRSRGVYHARARTHAGNHGSSPLARGLPWAGPARVRAWRIIPARAGFTGWSRSARRQRGDHPRSRGVYGTTTSPARSPTGSSPLARGLPSTRPCGTIAPGIIPARAGFTRARRREWCRRRDHPRSRGVYIEE